ncbi:MAG: hypothetical protein N2484_08655 [Clostridia bacterium]|nr:hypothetical protein [Clostridia bacterium]
MVETYDGLIGEGNIDFKYIFEDILKDFNERIIFEIPESDEKIHKSKAILLSILMKQEVKE